MPEYSWEKRFYKRGNSPIDTLDTLSIALTEAAYTAQGFKQDAAIKGLDIELSWGYIASPPEFIEVWVCSTESKEK